MMFGVHASACPAALTRLEPIGRRRKVCWSRKRRIVKRGKSIGKSGSFLWRSQRLVEPGERARAGQFHEFTRISEIPDTLTIARRSRNRSSADFQVGCVAGFPTRCPYGCRWSCRLGSRRHSRFGNLRYEVRRSLSGKSSRLVTILTDSSTKKRSTLNFQSLAGSKRSEDRSLPTSYIQINPPSSGHCPCWPLDWPGDRAQWPCPDRRTRPSPCRETGNCRVCHPD